MNTLWTVVKTSVCILFFICWNGQEIFSQNVGINRPIPTATLDVNGTTKTNSLIINSGGAQYDFLVKSNGAGDIGYRKGHQAQALRYIMCETGVYPGAGWGFDGSPYLGMIMMIPFINPNIIPVGWIPCEGQFLPIGLHVNLFSLIGNTYGGDGVSTFAMPDLRGTAPIGAGNGWTLGQRSN